VVRGAAMGIGAAVQLRGTAVQGCADRALPRSLPLVVS
jgi:hypothetical protein